MINLLPPQEKRQIVAGQTNVILMRYCVISLMLAGLLILVTGGVYVIMMNTKARAEEAIALGNQKTAQYATVQQEATEFANNLSTAKTILGKEVAYSKVAVKIAQALPSGIVLQSLSLDAKTFGTPTTLNAKGKNYADALRLKTSLENSGLFSNVNLASVTMASDGAKSGYPTAIIMNVTIKPEVAKK